MTSKISTATCPTKLEPQSHLCVTQAGQRLRKFQYTLSKPKQVSTLDITALKSLPSKEKPKLDSRAS